MSGSTGVQPSAEAIGDIEKILARAHAEGVAEGRAAMLREVVEWLRCEDERRRLSDRGMFSEYLAAANAIEARFPSEGTT